MRTMTREEKIEIMFESILSEMEKISKLLGSTNPKKVQNDQSILVQKFDILIQKLNSLKIPLYKPDLGPVHNKLDVIMTHLKGPIENDNGKVLNHQNGQFFPTFIRWLNKAISSKMSRAFIVLLLSSLGFNYYLVRDYDEYKQSHLKYMFIYYSGNENYLRELDSIWRIDSLRQRRLGFIERRKVELATVQNLDQNIRELHKGLDSLKLKLN